MKKIKFIGILALIASVSLVSCGTDIEDVNDNPNSPENVPTNSIFASATKEYFSSTRDEFNHGRFMLNWVEYLAQNSYADEDRYLYRETSATNSYNIVYGVATDLQRIIELNTDPDTKAAASAYGANENQIAASRIILAYMFHQLTNTFGDVPYWSYGSNDPDFQALQVDEFLSPVFTEQKKIYSDLLKELRESADMINVNAPTFTKGDNIFNGDAAKWKKLANSLIVRIATNMKGADAGAANTAIAAALASGVMTSNSDNAAQQYENNDANGNALWIAFIERTDFGVAAPFVDLLKGATGDFGPDPRLFEMAAPISASIDDVQAKDYAPSTDYNDYVGVPYGYKNVNKIGQPLYSFPSSKVITADFGEMLIEYSEVEFLISEYNGFSQVNYENGVRASMEKWGVPTADIDAFVGNLPAADKANVLNQKYVALFMQGHQSYAEIRRTGYPDTSILFLPGDTYVLDAAHAAAAGETSFTFISGVTGLTTLPNRVRYPQILQTLNGTNRSAAAAKLDDGDTVMSKLFWDVN